MSDDEEVPEVKKQRMVQFGSLADAMSAKIAQPDAAVPQTEDSDHIQTSQEYMEVEKPPDATREMMLAEFERRRKARSLILPTDDGEVKVMLRQLSEPICLFGEDGALRRERLRTILSLLSEEEKLELLGHKRVSTKDERQAEETWYHEGSMELKQGRIFIAKYSIPRAQERLEKAREQQTISVQERSMKIQDAHKWIRGLTACSSQFGDNRPMSYCQFSPNSQYIATASWSGSCKLWNAADCSPARSYQGHSAGACCVVFHPQATISQEPYVLNLASSAQDGSVKLWTMENDEPLADLEGHAPYRVSRIAFHPSGRFLATCCFDHAWRLFDLECNEEILFQEGHSDAVYDIHFQADGSLALTGGLDAYGRVWDLRTGRCIMFLDGHLKGILTVSFSPNGYQMATGSQDNTCKLWDLRMRRCIYTIPAHQSLVSKLKFDERNNCFMVTASYDNTLRLWSNPGWQPLRTLQGHDSKVMCVDVSSNGKYIVSSSFDRTFKLWSAEGKLA